MLQASTTGTAGSVLLILALLPAVALCIYIYIKDRVEKEPIGLLLLLLVFGALSALPVLAISAVTDPIIHALFASRVSFDELGNAYVTSDAAWYAYNAVDNFLGVALIEEFCKWMVLWIVTRRNRQFNCTFDAVVYAVFVSLGFAALENVLYAFSYGLETVLMRAVISVPGHMFFGVLMGFYYSRWKVCHTAAVLERVYVREGRFAPKSPLISGKRALVCSVLIPVLAHGFFDFALSVGSALFIVLFYVSLAFLYFHCFRTVRRMSREDSGIQAQAMLLMAKKYGGFI